MNADRAILEVCQRFCSTTGDAHDDACLALREALAEAQVYRRHIEIGEKQVAAIVALADRADARADIDRRLVTTDALRAALDSRPRGGLRSSRP